MSTAGDTTRSPRLLILIPNRFYRTEDFLNAARRHDATVTVGCPIQSPLTALTPDSTLLVDFFDHRRATDSIVRFAARHPLQAIIGVDETTTWIAANAAQALGLKHNPPPAVATAHNKYRCRSALKNADLPTPNFSLLPISADVEHAAALQRYPCVLKPLDLSASRGVIRADDSYAYIGAVDRITPIIKHASRHTDILVESFVEGPEVIVEALLIDGKLMPLAIFDKPDMSDGPYFEEHMLITPSRLADDLQQSCIDTVATVASAIGLRHGPLHAELRINQGTPVPIEIAARSIGGLCSRILHFDNAMTLEDLIIGDALGITVSSRSLVSAAGVMMIPIPKRGVLKAVHGVALARACPHIADVRITIPINQIVLPVPEGDRYLGFIFAAGDTPEIVQAALEKAHRKLSIVIDHDTVALTTA